MTVGNPDNGERFVTYRALMEFGNQIRSEIRQGFEDLKENTNTGSANRRANIGIGTAAAVGVGSLVMNIIQLYATHKG